MQDFFSYIADQSISASKNHVASLLVEQNLDPYLHIEHFLKTHQQSLLNEWLDSFFKRMGNAWNGFWKSPKDQPVNQLELARQALNDLHRIVANHPAADMKMVLRGLEQSLAILDRIKPTLKQHEDVPHSGEENKLPKEWHEKWASLVQRQHSTMKEPDGEEKKNKLIALDDEFEQFWTKIQDYYQSLPNTDPNKQAVKYFLQSIDADTSFRDIRDLLDTARKRTQNNLLVNRPDVYRQVAQVWHQLAAKNPDIKGRAQQLMRWYQGLQSQHPLKQFIHKEMQDSPDLGENEANVFWKYAVEWINKFPHHAAVGE